MFSKTGWNVYLFLVFIMRFLYRVFKLTTNSVIQYFSHFSVFSLVEFSNVAYHWLTKKQLWNTNENLGNLEQLSPLKESTQEGIKGITVALI